MRSSSAYNIPKRGTTSIAVSFIRESPQKGGGREGGGMEGGRGGKGREGGQESSWHQLSNTPFKLEEFF